MKLDAAAHALLHSLGAAAEQPSFLPLVEAMRDVLHAVGLPVDRIQVPMSRRGGFRHPTYAVVVVTWCHDVAFDESFVVAHDQLQDDTLPLVRTPYRHLEETGQSFLQVDLDHHNLDLPLFSELSERGYHAYAAVELPIPGDSRQPMSIASRQPFPADLHAILAPLLPVFALAVYGAYRTSQAMRLASTYIGPQSGARVLAGDIRRGSTRRMTAGILFCDIRGFTAYSERSPPEAVVATVNEVFAVVEAEARVRGGEILKFIGDAMLLVFPVDAPTVPLDRAPATQATVARAMVDTAKESLRRMAESDLCVQIAFGGTVGEVIQGNVGTPERLDFTVMGTAVNLASRLEALCRPLDASAVFSRTVALYADELVPAGAHTLKGLSQPVPVYRLLDAEGVDRP